MSISLNFKELGEGKPLIVLHGLFGSLDNWSSLGRQWAEYNRVFLVDLRNHGKSPHTADHNYPAMANDIVDFIDQHQLSDVTLLGHSMGGKVVMETALQRPDLVAQLIVADMSPRPFPRGHDDIFEAMNALDFSSITSRKEIETVLMEKLQDIGVVLFLSKNIKRSSNGFEWKFNKSVLEDSYENVLMPVQSSGIFDKPTLFLKGENSNYIRSEDRESIVQLFPQAQIKTIFNAGHWLHADNPKQFFDEVSLFIGTT
ncbi:alpha/beta fold hydrolase [Membranihabitans marinus]|uniref:alpha/beta fold hydrolase n=1 Tax=Membranihabitans marinus TaxID=1227546 RepID=UPI001F257251|nr:alpha/beta fold hydrolase [Membranihabitans marinus]